jgi:hypothetical protein
MIRISMKNIKKNQGIGLLGRCLLGVSIALGSAGCTGLNPQGVSTLMGMGLYQTRTNAIKNRGNRNNSQKIMTSEIWNLETGKKEIEIVDWDSQIPYFKSKGDNFSKAGYKVLNQINDKSVSKGYIVHLIDGELKAFDIK